MNAADRQYIRRFLKNGVRKDRTILPTAFAMPTGDKALSFTLRGEILQTVSQLERYQASKRLSVSGDLPGLCFLTHPDLTEHVQSPLPPRLAPDHADPEYGFLHHETDPPDDTQRNMMATKATQNGVLLPCYVKRKQEWVPPHTP